MSKKGSVYYDKSHKNWYGSITTPTGKRAKKSFATKTEATVWVTAQMAAINSKNFVEPRVNGRLHGLKFTRRDL